ncbi:hypothetical protein RB653_002138 [Dictyostelium firmibasis]|uniref:tRNA N(3)-methylcytidine methyltransferase n=1 Tax=Dictyostelium firmibasis TaxID=79012 RepID=A0AAN7TWY4_9MYCE
MSNITSDNRDNNDNDIEPTVGSKRSWTDVNYKFCNDKEKQVVEEIQTETSWADVDWDSVRESVCIAKSITEKETDMIGEDDKNHHEANAMDYWDKFYKKNQNKFFKDRTYLHLEFPELNPLNITRDETFIFFEDDEEQQNGGSNNNENNLYQDKDDLEKQEKEREKKMANLLSKNVNVKELKDRWIKETDQLVNDDSKKLTVLEIGCGTGATVYPLLKLNPEKYFYVFDFSPHAVNLVKSNSLYNEEKLKAFVCDIATEQIPTSIVKDNSIDMMLMIFVLSAISRDKMHAVATSLFKSLKPGGVLYIRDYGLYDMTQLRFISKKGKKIDENFYLRADGTRTYFFTTQILSEIFEAAGFKTLVSKYDTRELRNRKRMISMYRVWVRGKFMKPLDTENTDNNSKILSLYNEPTTTSLTTTTTTTTTTSTE